VVDPAVTPYTLPEPSIVATLVFVLLQAPPVVVSVNATDASIHTEAEPPIAPTGGVLRMVSRNVLFTVSPVPMAVPEIV